MEPTKSKSTNKTNKPTSNQSELEPQNTLYLQLDPVKLSLLVLSFLTRLYQLEYPRAIVFDELHYIKFITLYAKRIFFFDAQPPFGKQLLTLFASLVNFQGDLSYSQIGDPYKPELPIQSLRLLPCICGSLIAPLAYSICLNLNFRQVSAALVALLIITENSLLTQSKFLLIEPILLLFEISSFYFYLKFTKTNSILWLSLASMAVTLAVCTKYSGLYSYVFFLALLASSWWQLLGNCDTKKLIRTSLLYASCAILLPLVIYVSIFYLHLAWLTKAGPHDSIMTSAFQASLEDGLASITRGQPLEIVHGSQITLRHTHGRSCWLHSHEHLYPIKYADGRGSSHQQQVTCYSFKDANNWWIVKRPHLDELIVNEPHDKIRNGDIIQLVHGLSGRTLNSHDVASAQSPYSQEVSCYVDHNISMPAQDTWRVQLSNPADTNEHWHTLNSRLQLIHLNSSLALRFSGRQLPDWGFHQHEIVADKELKSDDTIWNVEEHRFTKTEDQKERELQMGQAEFVPLEPTSLTFIEKLYELHYKLLNYQQDAIKDHLYACESPLDWILQRRGTAYWADTARGRTAQIFLIGNVATNMAGVVSMVAIASILIFHILRRRRRILTDIPEKLWSKLQTHSSILICGYLVHFIPYFAYESPLFLQFYLNALIFKIFLIGALIDHLYDLNVKSYLMHALVALMLAISVGTFVRLSPLTYGFSLTREEVEKIRWKDTWQLIVANE